MHEPTKSTDICRQSMSIYQCFLDKLALRMRRNCYSTISEVVESSTSQLDSVIPIFLNKIEQ